MFKAPLLPALRGPLWLAGSGAAVATVVNGALGLSGFHLLVIGALLWAGWRANRALWGGIGYAAMAGPIVFIGGSICVGGALQLVFGDFEAAAAAAAGTWAEDWPRLAYSLGLLVAGILLAPLAALISVIGGFAAEYF